MELQLPWFLLIQSETIPGLACGGPCLNPNQENQHELLGIKIKINYYKTNTTVSLLTFRRTVFQSLMKAYFYSLRTKRLYQDKQVLH
jgi:hypothetical protein